MKDLPPLAQVIPQTFFDRDQLARRWKTSISTLKRREKSGELRPTRLGGRIVRYSMAHILAIEEAGTTQA